MVCELILASSSKRRREILKMTGVPFLAMDPGIPEDFQPGEDPWVLTERFALEKAKKVYMAEEGTKHVLGADTVVYLDEILSKPVDAQDAFRMLRMLSDREHEVITACVLMEKNKGPVHRFHEITRVTFSPLTDGEILAYIATGEPMDKAGAYGIQGIGGLFVQGIRGCYYNVMGFPLNRIYRLLQTLGLIFT